MHVAVTGANGFIGRALCKRLSKRDLAVRALVRRNVIVDGCQTVVTGPLETETSWSSHLKDVDTLSHLAAHVHVRGSRPDRFQSVNHLGTARLLEGALAAGVRRIVLLSSAGVHGSGSTSVVTEDSPLRPYNAY